MARETDPTDRGGDDAPDATGEDDRRGLDGQLLSDLSVNLVPIVIIIAFTLLFLALAPGDVGDTVLLFHGALIGGVVLVSLVAGWAIRRKQAPLEGSAARRYDEDRD